MNAREVIAMLAETDLDADVLIWDPDAEEWLPVTCCTHGGEPNDTRLYSDEP